MTAPLTLRGLAAKWRAERAHTYASENADHYRGFDAERLRSADELDALADAKENELFNEMFYSRSGVKKSWVRRALIGERP